MIGGSLGKLRNKLDQERSRDRYSSRKAVLFPGKTEVLSLAGDNKNGMKKKVNRAEIVEFACIWENSQGFKVNRQF